MSILDRIKRAAALTLRAVEFGYYHVLLSTVDRVSRLPRNTTVPEAMRLYRENIALKAQLEVLEAELKLRMKPAPVPMATRAAQVFAYFLTRGDEPFQRYSLSASLRTIKRWATRFRSLRHRPNTGGRPPLDAKVVDLILTLKPKNRASGQRRIREELQRMGIRVSEPTIARILKENGFSPHPGRKIEFDRVRSTEKDAVWALDYFAVQKAKGVWLQALLIIDVHTRELIDLRVHDGWDVDSVWTIRAFNTACTREKRTPKAVVHDHGTHFRGQFERQLRVLEIEEELTPPGLPSMLLRRAPSAPSAASSSDTSAWPMPTSCSSTSTSTGATRTANARTRASLGARRRSTRRMRRSPRSSRHGPTAEAPAPRVRARSP